MVTEPTAPYQLHPQEDLETPPAAAMSAEAPEVQPPAAQPAPAATQTAPVAANPSTQQVPSSIPGISKPPPEEILIEWEAKSRPFKQRSRQYFSTVAILVLLISLILFFAGQFLPIAVVISVGFLAYVLSVVPPVMVKHSLSTYGIRIEGNLYYWEEMGRFWFSQKYGDTLLHLEIDRFPGRLTILLGDLPEEAMKNLLSEVLLFQKPTPTFFDRAAEWIEQKIPLEDPQRKTA